MSVSWVDRIKWTADGLVPVIAQEETTGVILMFASMNKEAVKLTVETKVAIYWSRSKQKLRRKGEESGHTQKVKAIYLDCDDDVLLIQVEQIGGIACHTGRKSCFFNKLERDQWVVNAPIIKDPSEIYQ